MPIPPHPRLDPLLGLAQALGLTATAVYAGHTIAQSTLLLPALLTSPAPLLLRQWHRAVTSSSSTRPLFALTALLAGCCFHARFAHATRWFGAAATLVWAAVPYRWLILQGTATELMRRAEEEMVQRRDMEEPDGVMELQWWERRRMGWGEMVRVGVWPDAKEVREALSVHQLVDVWGCLALGRAGVVLTGAGCAVWAVIGGMVVGGDVR